VRVRFGLRFISRASVLFSLWGSSLAMGEQVKMKDQPFVVDLASIPTKLEPAHVQTAYDHVLLRHLNRALLGLNKGGELVGDLAEAWDFDSTFTTFTFTLRKDAKFSNGDPITIKDVVESIARQKRHKDAIHAEFTKIKEFGAIPGNKLRIVLAEPNQHFLLNTRQPEFGVLHATERASPLYQIPFKITSGAYSVEEKSESIIKVQRNKFYEKFIEGSPETVLFQNAAETPFWKKVKTQEIDLVYGTRFVETKEDIDELKSAKYELFAPHIGFTYWVGTNPRAHVMKGKENREYLQTILNPNKLEFDKISPIWTRATQIYMPDGAGRPSPAALKAFWTRVEGRQKPSSFPLELRFLTRNKSPVQGQLDDALARAGVKVKKIVAKDAPEFYALLQKGEYDIDLSNNDMAGTDVLENLLVIFNKKAPLMFLQEGSQVPQWLHEASNDSSRVERYKRYELIGTSLLEEANITPIAYLNRIFYLKPGRDTSHWSTLYSDITLWRLPRK
jgi:MarR-like DNA-binding transcriptional regulator SgrR of sgrS sRNA